VTPCANFFQVLKGHDGGVLSLSWCQQDSDLLLSCGKDNRNICWNPQTGDSYGEYSVVTNWTFQTRWNPHNPSFMATASFDGKISIQSIQNTKPEAEAQAGNQSQAADDEDFFSKAHPQSQGSTFSLQKAPKWLQRPCGASFGFGGKIVSFKTGTGEGNTRSMVRISTYAIDDGVVASTQSFEASLKQNDLDKIFNTRMTEAADDAEKADWKVIKTLTSKNTRKELVDYLGFSTHEDEAADGISKLSVNGNEKDTLQAPEDNEASAPKSNRLSAFFDNSADGDNFPSELAATKGAKTNNPFHMYSGSESESDRRITRALLLGEFEKALDVCLQENRMSDAFMIAICGGQKCVDKAQKAYFSQKEGGPNYLRLLASVVGKNLWDLVHNADLEQWKEVIATICTYADAKEFPDLCEALGDRLEEKMNAQGGNASIRKDASCCYLAGSKLEKVVAIWIAELQEHENAGLQDLDKGSSFSVHARTLQSFIEKVTVFREVTNYRDEDVNAESDWKLTALYDKYIEYADIASAHGQLPIAERYLDLLPNKYPAADVARGRVKRATSKAPQQQTQKAPATTGRPGQRLPPSGTDFQHQQQPPIPAKPIIQGQPNPYAPPGATSTQNPYAPTNGQTYGSSGYPNPTNYQQPQPPQQQYGPPYPNQPLGPPPRNINSSPSIPPPSKASNIANWNDTPADFFKPPTSRRNTPGPSANAPQPYQPVQNPAQNFAPPPRSTPPLGPPPKAGAGPPRISSPPMNGSQSFQQPERPSSTANVYAPQQPSLPVQQQAPVPRGPSPYNAPPSGPPPSNRYAPAQPAPSAQQENQTMMGGGRQPPPPSNPYAPQQSYNVPRQSVPQHPPPAGPPQQSAPPSGPPQAPPQDSRPNTAQSQRRAPPPSKYRKPLSHINLNVTSHTTD